MVVIEGTSDPLFRLRIEEVHVVEIGNEQHAIAGRARRLRRHPADHLMPRDLEEDQCVGAEWFDYGGRCFDGEPKRLSRANEMCLANEFVEALRPYLVCERFHIRDTKIIS